MALKTLYPFDNESNYTFDPAKMEFVAGNVKLLPLVSGSAALAYWKLDELDGLVAIDSTINENHGAFQGGFDEINRVPGKIGNGIKGTSTTQGFINFSQQIIFERTDSFSLEFWISFTVGISTSRIIISKQSNVGSFPGLSCSYSSGKILWTIRDNSSNIIGLITNNAYNDSNFHHVICTYDGSSIQTGLKIYVDNVLNYSVNISGILSDTITNNADFQISGRDGNNVNIDADTKLDEVVVYNRELNAAEVSFRWNGGAGTQEIPGATTVFPTDNPLITTKGTITITELVDFDATIIQSGLDAILYTVLVNGIEYYWDSSVWAVSAGYPDVNTAADIKANIATLTVSGISAAKLNRYLHSDDGSTTPELSEDYLEYNYIPGAVNLQFATVNGSIFDFNGDPTLVTITVQTVRKIIGSSIIITSNPIPIIYDSITGNWTVDLFYEDVEPIELKWLFNSEIVITNFLAGINNFNTLTVV